jgi:hypothetical protein
MNEAKGSFNGFFRSKAGGKQQFTLRQDSGQSDADFVARVRNFMLLLEVGGWRECVDTQARTEGGQASAENGEGDARPSNNSFEIQSIKLAAGGDHPRWVVRGGNFVKFGVTCWPETLEAAGLAEKLDPMKDNKPKGQWIAHYNERQNDEGRWVPDKVTRIAKASAI